MSAVKDFIKIALICLGVFVAVVAILGIIGISAFAIWWFWSRSIDLPDVEDVMRIYIGSVTTTNRDDIDTIMSALSGARRVSRGASNEHPFAQNALNIYGVVGRLYLYTTNDGDERLWKSYVGIYRISQENADKLRRLYADMAEAD